LLKAELMRRQASASGGAIAPTTRVADLADAWLAATKRSITTDRLYRTVVAKHVKPALGQLRVQEVTAGVVTRALRTMGERSGPSVAKTARTCLSGLFSLAVEDGAASVNPVRDSSARMSTERRAPRALTPAQTRELRALFAGSDRARELDLCDLVDWMLATGCRIGEALAARVDPNSDGALLLDLEARTWEVNATVVRAAGSGLVIQPRPKTKAGWRVVALPASAVRTAWRRFDRHQQPLLFPAPVSRALRDPTNVSGDLRGLLDGFDCAECNGTGYQLDDSGGFVLNDKKRRVRCSVGPWSWITSHTFRKTVATRLDEAGFTPRQVADQLGHANPSMTLDVYFGRQVVSSAAADVLDLGA
jgi:integrase